MCDPDFVPSRVVKERSEPGMVEASAIGFGACLQTQALAVAEVVDAMAREVADCVPVKVALLDRHLRTRALNAEWRRFDPACSAALGHGFVNSCLSTASVSSRNDVAARLANLGRLHSNGFETQIDLDLQGMRRSFTLRARRMSHGPEFVVVALLSARAERGIIARIVLDAEEAERRRIARELHDDTAQRLAAIQLGLAGLREYGTGDQFDSRCRDIEAILRSVQDELRTLSYTLHPPEIGSAGLGDALGCFVSGFARRTRLKAMFVDETLGAATDGVTDRVLYRVTQEALTNVGKHAEATNAVVRLREYGQRLVLEVEDDGIGIAPELCSGRFDARLGVGLSSMRERIEALAGRFEVLRLDTGTRVRAILPVRCGGKGSALRAL